MPDWLAYSNNKRPKDTPKDTRSGLSLPPPPPWRDFRGAAPGDDTTVRSPPAANFRATTFQASDSDVEMINAALYLRRPLLVTGKPGSGKSSLAHSVAFQLGLGEVLQWPITSRSALKDGLYRYDAVARLQDTSLKDKDKSADNAAVPPDVGRYVRLGPLGTALLPQDLPRVLVIDELDKSDIDLPNDLLNIFEEGEFEIPELSRLSDSQEVVQAMTADVGDRTPIKHGVVRCRAFPLVVITSNGEREFPPAFLRRCLRLQMEEPDAEKLADIVEAHLPKSDRDTRGWLIDAFLSRSREGTLATDQLLNAVYLVEHDLVPKRSRDELAKLLLPHLDATPG